MTLSEKRTIRLPCMCTGECSIVHITEWDDDDPAFYVESYQHISYQPRLRDRARIAWAVVRGREPYTHGVMLSVEDAHRLGEFLTPRPAGDEGGTHE